MLLLFAPLIIVVELFLEKLFRLFPAEYSCLHFSVAFPITLFEMPIVPVETMGIDGHRLCIVRHEPFTPSESDSSH